MWSTKAPSTVWPTRWFHPTCARCSEERYQPEAARKVFDYMLHDDRAPGPRGEAIFYSAGEVSLKAPIVPKKFFIPAGNFREHHEEATKVGFSHPVMRGSCFFRMWTPSLATTSRIYPEHLTQELDYELELAVVFEKKGGKHFTPEEAAGYMAVTLSSMTITASRHSAPRDEKSAYFSFCKGIDTFCPLGPWIVTADELPIHIIWHGACGKRESRQRSHSSKCR